MAKTDGFRLIHPIHAQPLETLSHNRSLPGFPQCMWIIPAKNASQRRNYPHKRTMENLSTGLSANVENLSGSLNANVDKSRRRVKRAVEKLRRLRLLAATAAIFLVERAKNRG
jgi:hypothetical protein